MFSFGGGGGGGDNCTLLNVDDCTLRNVTGAVHRILIEGGVSILLVPFYTGALSTIIIATITYVGSPHIISYDFETNIAQLVIAMCGCLCATCTHK